MPTDMCAKLTRMSLTIGHPEICRKRKSLSTDNTASSSQASLKSKKAKRRLSNLDVSDYIVKHAIHNQTELFAHAETRKQEGEVDLETFLFTLSEKSLSELIDKTWLLKTANKRRTVRMDARGIGLRALFNYYNTTTSVMLTLLNPFMIFWKKVGGNT